MRLIDADELKKCKVYSEERHEYVVAVFNIDNAPTVELQMGRMTNGIIIPIERPTGKWIGDTDLGTTCKCSECRMIFDTDRLKMVMCDGKYELPPCCPNCGARMINQNILIDKVGPVLEQIAETATNFFEDDTISGLLTEE